MVKVYSKALNKTIEVERIIGQLKGSTCGPTLIFMSGIHGNEPAGIFAFSKVMKLLKGSEIRGNIYGIAGNLSALRQGQRFHTEDLNRVWTQDRMRSLPNTSAAAKNPDVQEQIDIFKTIKSILESHEGPFYFFDMHTTSSETPPFLTVNDSLLNRYFTTHYPLPTILGIEEYLEGPILSYMNELGYVAFGFEAGQHDGLSSIENCVSFIIMSLIFAGALEKEEVEYHKYHDSLAKYNGDGKQIFEIKSRYLIEPTEDFRMKPGFYNFQKIEENQQLAISNGKPIKAQDGGRIFMPLYQQQGSDGFFMIKKIWMPFLKLSEFIRKHRLDVLLTFLPGVKWSDHSKSTIIVNRKIARFLAKDIFHLFGYRNSQKDRNHLIMYNREASAKTNAYIGSPWFN